MEREKESEYVVREGSRERGRERSRKGSRKGEREKECERVRRSVKEREKVAADFTKKRKRIF